MGTLYDKGLAVDQNKEAAFKCYQKAAELGCVKSCTKVAHMYYSGVKAHKFDDFDDDDLADYMATEATQAELDQVKFAIPPDRVKALKHYLRSAKKGDSEASNCAGLMLEKVNPVDAVDCYRRALEIDDKNTDAMLNMALLYYNTKEEKEWHEDALRLMQRASDLGNEKAHSYLEQKGLLGVYQSDKQHVPFGAVKEQTMGKFNPSLKKEVTLQWDLTRTRNEPSIRDDEIRDEVEETVSYQLTQTNTFMVGLDQASKYDCNEAEMMSGHSKSKSANGLKMKKSKTEVSKRNEEFDDTQGFNDRIDVEDSLLNNY